MAHIAELEADLTQLKLSLHILCAEEVISAGRVRELSGMPIGEQRKAWQDLNTGSHIALRDERDALRRELVRKDEPSNDTAGMFLCDVTGCEDQRVLGGPIGDGLCGIHAQHQRDALRRELDRIKLK